MLNNSDGIVTSFKDFLEETRDSDYNGIYVTGNALEVKIDRMQYNNMMQIQFSGNRALTSLKSADTLKSEYDDSDHSKLEKYWANLAKSKSIEIEKLVNRFEKDLNSVIVSMEKDLSKFN